jgi:hypothetical protein
VASYLSFISEKETGTGLRYVYDDVEYRPGVEGCSWCGGGGRYYWACCPDGNVRGRVLVCMAALGTLLCR